MAINHISKSWEPILQFKSQKTKLKPENPHRNEEENHLKLTIPSFWGFKMLHTLPETNSSPFALEKWWLEDDPFLLGFGNFSGANG